MVRWYGNVCVCVWALCQDNELRRPFRETSISFPLFGRRFSFRIEVA